MSDDARPNRGGRPRASAEGSRLSAWIPAAHHDRIAKLARANDLTVSKLVGAVIAVVVESKPPRPRR